MKFALALNAMILAAIVACVILLDNPMFFLGLLALVQLPYGLAQVELESAMRDEDEDEDDSRPIGFTQDVK